MICPLRAVCVVPLLALGVVGLGLLGNGCIDLAAPCSADANCPGGLVCRDGACVDTTAPVAEGEGDKDGEGEGEGEDGDGDDGEGEGDGAFPPGTPSHLPPGVDLRIDEAPIDVVAHCVGAVVNTDENGAIESFCDVDVPATNVAQADGQPALRVYVFRGLTLEGNVRFDGSRAPVLVVYGDATIAGIIDVGAAGVRSGPGVPTLCGASTGKNGADTDLAGVGGGGGGNNAPGGDAAGGFFFAQGGDVVDRASGALSGGCAGGTGGRNRFVVGAPRAFGGGGGGALQVSATGTLRLSGRVYADGGGGGGGASETSGGGGGGGAGGTVFLEGAGVDSSAGDVFIRGGGGGGGAGVAFNEAAADGGSGAPGRDEGAGGAQGSNGAAGGAGSTGAGGNGGEADFDTAKGGGGGGGGGGSFTQRVLGGP